MTPDNAGYYYAAYIATALIYIVYAISIGVRRRRTESSSTRGLESGRADQI